MKNVILIAACLLFGSMTHAQNSAVDVPTKVINKAKVGGAKFFNLIPQGQESEYGFESREEFSKVSYGAPYQMYFVVKKEGKVSFKATNNWRVPVLVNGKSVALLTVLATADVAEVVEFGAVKLASKLQEFEEGYGQNNERVLLRNTYLTTDYIVPQFSALSGKIVDGVISMNAVSGAELFPIAETPKAAVKASSFMEATINAPVQ